MAKSSNTLKELVYLDGVSMNNHLASIGEGIDEHQIHSQESKRQSDKSIKSKIPGMGVIPSLGSIGYSRNIHSGQKLETTSRLQEANHFFKLVNESANYGRIKISESDDIPTKNEEYNLKRGDVIEVTGELHSMALFKMITAFSVFQEYVGEDAYATTGNTPLTSELNALIQNIPPDIIDQEKWRDVRESLLFPPHHYEQFLRNFLNDLIHMRLEVGDFSFGIAFIRDYFRVLPTYLFRQSREFTVFGKVVQVLTGNEEWYPSSLVNVAAGEIGDPHLVEAFRKNTKTVFEAVFDNNDLLLTDQDLRLKSPSAIIHPIGLYW